MNRTKIVYVDDDPDIREIVGMCLELEPAFEARLCSTGWQALAEAATWKPDLMLLDVMMPEMDGPEVLRRLREDPETAGIEVVFVTARTMEQDIRNFVDLGAKGTIAKPFDPLSLAAEVKSFL